MEEKTKKWYDSKWAVHILLIVFFPVGLYALWKSNTLAKWWKIGATVLIALIVVSNIVGDDETVTSTNQGGESAKEASPLTQEQKDSIGQVEREALIKEREDNTWTASQVINHYEQNEIQADIDLKDKWFFVTGKVGSVKKDILGDLYVTLETSNIIREVQCYFDDTDEKVLAGLQKGQSITIRGTCDGLMMNVQMKDCRIVPNLEDL